MVETMGRFPQSECNNRKAGKAPQLTIQPYNKNNFNMVKVAEQWGLLENTGLSEEFTIQFTY